MIMLHGASCEDTVVSQPVSGLLALSLPAPKHPALGLLTRLPVLSLPVLKLLALRLLALGSLRSGF